MYHRAVICLNRGHTLYKEYCVSKPLFLFMPFDCVFKIYLIRQRYYSFPMLEYMKYKNQYR